MRILLNKDEKKVISEEKPSLRGIIKQAFKKKPKLKREKDWGKKYDEERTGIARKQLAGAGLLGTSIIGGTIAGAKIIKNRKEAKKQEEARKRIIGEKTDAKLRKAVSGTEVEEKVNKILDKSAKEMKGKQFSKQDREVVPQDIVEKVKKSGVIQKDHQGHWRIISMKTKTNKSGKAEFWSGHYNSKKDARSALGNYWKNKH